MTLAALYSLYPCFQSAKRHVLTNGDYPGTPPTIMACIATLGLDITDVKEADRQPPLLNFLASLSGADLYPTRLGRQNGSGCT